MQSNGAVAETVGGCRELRDATSCEEEFPELSPRCRFLADKIVDAVKSAESKGGADRLAVAIAKMDLLMETTDGVELTLEEICDSLLAESCALLPLHIRRPSLPAFPSLFKRECCCLVGRACFK